MLLQQKISKLNVVKIVIIKTRCKILNQNLKFQLSKRNIGLTINKSNTYKAASLQNQTIKCKQKILKANQIKYKDKRKKRK